ncbi:MAG: dicarboxylate/amino acid:cation symporter [Clostridia bacterium]|nr:dicarboxylate/amino acid:cation symporter [Clostridia bacterium]
MKNFWKNYKSTLILIAAIIVGAFCGIYFGEKAAIVQPLGDIFLNMMFIVIVPLIFLTVTSSIAKMTSPKRLGKIIITIFGVFIFTSLVSVFVGLGVTQKVPLVTVDDEEAIFEQFSSEEEVEIAEDDMSILERTVQVLTVNDFSQLLSKGNLIALLVVSLMVGIAIHMTGDASKPMVDFIISANAVLMKLIQIIMYYAPIGIGCYIAALVGTLGKSIAVGFLRTFIVYTIVCIAFYFVVYSIYALIAGGFKGLAAFWKNVLPATFTSIATCSSAACIPVNVETAKKIGVSADIAETTIPLGTSFHKDGSIIGSAFKIMFLAALFPEIAATAGMGKLIIVSLLATLLVMAVPIGGGTISEMLILTMMGFPLYALPILSIIATIIDAPATMLNVVGDSASSMLVARVIDGRHWINKVVKPKKEKTTETKSKKTKK